jgi:hypothetical protein
MVLTPILTPIFGVDFLEFPGVGHLVGGDESLLRSLVFPAVTEWLDRRVGATW